MTTAGVAGCVPEGAIVEFDTEAVDDGSIGGIDSDTMSDAAAGFTE